jgi:S1-C subfamily serine protease
MDIKTKYLIVLLGVAGGVLGTALTFLLTGNISNSDQLGTISQNDLENTIQDVDITASETPVDLWHKLVSEKELTSVAIQTFKNAELIRYGNGIILSSDGLIATTVDVVPYGSYIYQIAYDSRIFRGTVVLRDYSKNVALVKVGATGLNVTKLDMSTYYGSGTELVLTGKFVRLSQPVLFSQRAVVNYVMGDLITLDTIPSAFLSGAQAVHNNGGTLGIVYLRGGYAHLINSEILKDSLENYFNNNR